MVVCFGLTGKTLPEKSLLNKLPNTVAPTDSGLLLAPITAMECGLNNLSR